MARMLQSIFAISYLEGRCYMSVELKRLIEKVSHMDITLIAGKGGISNIVTWVHMVETKEASTFLEGGEIAFSTGIGLNHSLSLLDLVQNIWKHQASGIVLNIGPFLETISQEVINFGNENNFPIFLVPWKTHIAEIIRIFSYSITKSEQVNLTIASAFKNAIFFPKQEELYLVPLTQYGFKTNSGYHVCVIKVVQNNTQPIDDNRLTHLTMYIDNFLQHRKYKSFTAFSYEDNILLVLADYVEENILYLIRDLKEYLGRYLQATEKYFMGIGKCTKSIRCLYKSYHQAINIQKLQMNGKFSPNMISYSDLGIYKLLMGIEDADILSEYYEKTLKPLEEYDSKNRSNMCQVLRSYLNNNGSVKDTSSELYVHRNTVNYKLNKLSEILNINLSDLDTRLQLSLAFMLRDML